MVRPARSPGSLPFKAMAGGFRLMMKEIFLTAIKVEWHSPAAAAIPLMAASGIGWIAGVAGLRRFGVPVLLLLVVVPPAFLLRWQFGDRQAAQVWMGADGTMQGNGLLQRWFGPDITTEGASLGLFWEWFLPWLTR